MSGKEAAELEFVLDNDDDGDAEAYAELKNDDDEEKQSLTGSSLSSSSTRRSSPDADAPKSESGNYSSDGSEDDDDESEEDEEEEPVAPPPAAATSPPPPKKSIVVRLLHCFFLAWYMKFMPSLCTKPCFYLTPRGLKNCLLKYFCFGRARFKSNNQAVNPDGSGPAFFNAPYIRFIYRRPLIVQLFGPALVVWVVWLILMCLFFDFSIYGQSPSRPSVAGWQIALMMIAGAFIGGSTCLGAGAVVFPLMTLVFRIPPDIARDFALMIQSVGLTAACVSMLYGRAKICVPAVVYGSIGGAVGMILGLSVLAPNVPGRVITILFVSVFLAFMITFLFLNRVKKRVTLMEITANPRLGCINIRWKEAVFLLTGFAGGILTSFAGAGINICLFSVLVLLFRVTEKVAIPTSVFLIAINCLIGFLTRALLLPAILGYPVIAPETWSYWLAAIPIVVVFGPLGSLVAALLHRQTVAVLVYIVDFAQFIGALLILPLDHYVGVMSAVIVLSCLIFFTAIAMVGQVYITFHQQRVKKNAQKAAAAAPPAPPAAAASPSPAPSTAPAAPTPVAAK